MAMAAVYYLLPKISGRVIHNYDFAVYGFWTLLFFGCWMGGRHLIGGPVPAWIPTMAIVCAWLVLFHHIIVYFNLREVFRPGSSTVLKFLAIGLGSYLLSAVVDTAFASRILAEVTQFTFFQQAQMQLAFGSVTLIIFGALYYLVPRLAGAHWPSVSLIRGHFLAAVLGFILFVVALGAAGWTQGMGLNDTGLTFVEIAAKTKSWLLVATAAQGVLLVGNLLFLVHFLWLAVGQAPVWKLIRQPSAAEATVS
jgi:cytochrome c oxidase cbb3-type subunit 1